MPEVEREINHNHNVMKLTTNSGRGSQIMVFRIRIFLNLLYY